MSKGVGMLYGINNTCVVAVLACYLTMIHS